MLSPVRTVAPAVSAVSLAGAKDYLRVTSNDEDTLIAALVGAAVSQLDGWTGLLGRCLVTQTWRQDYDRFMSCGLKLPFPDVQTVVVQYTDENDATQTLASTNYHLVNHASGSGLILSDGGSWPGVAARPDAVRITMVAGYGLAADVPLPLQMAMLLHIADLYSNRERNAAPLVSTGAYEALIAPYRRIGV